MITIDVRADNRGEGQTTTALFIAQALKLLTGNSVKLDSPFNEARSGTIPNGESYTLQELIVDAHSVMGEEKEVMVLDQYFQEKDLQARDLLPLEPCPFCGDSEHVKIQIIPPNYEVACQQCKITTGPYSTQQAAVKFWNQRHGD